MATAAEFLVGSIEGLAEQWNLSQTFVGLILLPIVGNAAEHVSAVTSAMKNKMELALGVAIGSSNQIALMVVPVTVLIGWAMGQPMVSFTLLIPRPYISPSLRQPSYLSLFLLLISS